MRRRPKDLELAKVLGRAARSRRRSLGLTQEEVALQLGLSSEFYARLERGHALPSVPTLSRLADTIGVSIDYLLGTTTEAFKAQTPRVLPPIDPPELRRAIRRLRNARLDTLRLVYTLIDQLERRSLE